MKICYIQDNKSEEAATSLSDWQKRMKKFMRDVSRDHPFTKMSKEEILKHLRQTREEVYDELYGDRYNN